METDFSVLGREKYLASIYYDTHFRYQVRDASFAKQTLLQRIIWSVKPNNTYCHLDGYDTEIIHHYSNGFFLVGKVSLLEPNEFGNKIYTAMAIEFDETIQIVKNGKIWISLRPVIKGHEFSEIEVPHLRNCFDKTASLGLAWQCALYRKTTYWSTNSNFDLSIFLNNET